MQLQSITVPFFNILVAADACVTSIRLFQLEICRDKTTCNYKSKQNIYRTTLPNKH